MNNNDFDVVGTNKISGRALVSPNAVMGENNTICDGAIICDGVILGDNNYIGYNCIIGDFPEKIGWFDKQGKVIIGNNNRFTKQVTIDSGTEHTTIVGNNVIMLKNAHIGHDAVIGDDVILSCNVAIGGHATIGRKCNFGLGAVCHQRMMVPEGCMIGMNSTITKKTDLRLPRMKYAGSPARIIGNNTRTK